MIYFFIFIIGSLFGSFLNVVIDRLPNGKSILYPPSHCPHCRHRLGFWDLIPLLSFFYLRGRCRYCKAKISWYYPLVEAVTGGLFVLTAFLSEFVFIIFLLLIISSLITVFFIDLKYGIIPFKIVVFALVIITIEYLLACTGLLRQLSWLAMTSSCGSQIFNYFLSGLGAFGGFLFLFLLTKGRGIGFGDVVFAFLMGYLLGFPRIILALYISFLTGAFFSLILIMAGKKKLRGGIIAFGPFLVLGTIVSLFWGQTIIETLMRYLNVY